MVSEKELKRKNTCLFIILIMLVIFAICFYLFARIVITSWRTSIPINGPIFWTLVGDTMPIIIGILLASMIIATVTLNFQTTTESKILTPSMLGFDAVFVVTQVVLVITFGAGSIFFANEVVHFFITAGVMVFVSFLMFGAILRKNKNNLMLLLLFGLVLSTILRSFTSWIMQNMDTTDFMFVQSATWVTINDMNTRIIPFIAPIMIGITIIMTVRHKTYDALSLGADNAKNLGVIQEREFKVNLILVAIGMAFATALIGSVTFLGLLVVNMSRQIFKTYKHKTLFTASALLASFALIFGQGLVEVFDHRIPVTIFIDLIGCTYMFYLIIKENKKI